MSGCPQACTLTSASRTKTIGRSEQPIRPKTLPKLPEAVLAEAARIAHPTWAELGRITPDGAGQTEAGAAAERDISLSLVATIRTIIAEIRSPSAKF